MPGVTIEKTKNPPNLDIPLSTRVPKATTPSTYEITCAVADTEYSQELPANVKRFTIKARGGRIDFGFKSGARHIRIADGGAYWEENLEASLTLYVSSPTAGTVAEVVAWT